ncbi:hypothetical protein M422DRAFT_210080 [Sphaerobolus stellatus SS14]|uniref:Calcineurin-like phosphoesterase domain-containing protein n=1 Tax=Sphaerobolus stellatus (strain SS14) TaxID=990650 RepID=A0A0C9UY96_SPHS4|nr:hypothetical protein M422DRAFT_210080 [Sphaerobolus stellatus SS14]
MADSTISSEPRLPHTLTAPGIAVYQWYQTPPRHPGPEWTRFVCVSDTHDHTFDVPPGDVLIHGGDLTETGSIATLRDTMHWIYDMPHKFKLVIAGNHDVCLSIIDHQSSILFLTRLAQFTLDKVWYQRENHDQKDAESVQKDLEDAENLVRGEEAKQTNVIYLEYASTEIQVKPGGRKWKIYGSPGSPAFGGMAFNYPRGKNAQELHANIPDDTDILITHGPPYSILDKVIMGGRVVGCKELFTRLAEIKPALHVFGHIHEDRGAQIYDYSAGETVNNSNTVFVNAANMPLGNKWTQEKKSSGTPRHALLPPIIVDLLDLGDDEVTPG